MRKLKTRKISLAHFLQLMLIIRAFPNDFFMSLYYNKPERHSSCLWWKRARWLRIHPTFKNRKSNNKTRIPIRRKTKEYLLDKAKIFNGKKYITIRSSPCSCFSFAPTRQPIGQWTSESWNTSVLQATQRWHSFVFRRGFPKWILIVMGLVKNRLFLWES